jgi:hypothetical protein
MSPAPATAVAATPAQIQAPMAQGGIIVIAGIALMAGGLYLAFSGKGATQLLGAAMVAVPVFALFELNGAIA